jgi:hypothetical protein
VEPHLFVRVSHLARNRTRIAGTAAEVGAVRCGPGTPSKADTGHAVRQGLSWQVAHGLAASARAGNSFTGPSNSSAAR